MIDVTAHVELPKGYTTGKLPSDFIVEYVRELPNPMYILIEAMRELRREEQVKRDKYEKTR